MMVDTRCAVCEGTIRVQMVAVIDGILEDREHDGQLTNFICPTCIDDWEDEL